MNYQQTAKEIVLNYANKHIDKTDNVFKFKHIEVFEKKNRTMICSALERMTILFSVSSSIFTSNLTKCHDIWICITT